MFKHTKDNFINSTNGRLYVLLAVFLILYGILTVRIFYLQIVNGEETLNDFTLKIQKERTINSTRGKIYDCNGVLLAYNELAYNVTIEDVYESGSDKNRRINETLLQVIDVIEKTEPLKTGNYYPVFENAYIDLEKACYNKAFEIYNGPRI